MLAASKMINKGINRSNLFRVVITLFVMLVLQFGAQAAEFVLPGPPYSVEQLRAWHKSMEPWPWYNCQPEQKVNLRNERNYELLMAISGYARGCTFLIFVRDNDTWSQISDEIEQAHHRPYILQTQKDGWHDFETYIPTWGSGGAEVWVFTYTWNGNKYILKNEKDGKWCDQEPFKIDKKLCPNR